MTAQDALCDFLRQRPVKDWKKYRTLRRAFYLSREWRELSLELRKKFHKCMVCGTTAKRDCHHIKKLYDRPDLALDSSNVVVLCSGKKGCHMAVERRQRALRTFGNAHQPRTPPQSSRRAQ